MANLFQRWRSRSKSRGQKSDRLTPDGLRITELAQPVQRLLRLYGFGGSYGNIFRAQPNVRAAVDLLASQAAELKPKHYEKVPRSGALPSERLELDSDLMVVLGEPTPGQSTYRFWYGTYADIEVFDIAYWWKQRVRGVTRALVRVPPSQLLPVYDNANRRVDRWRMQDGTEIEHRDLVVFYGYDPDSNSSSISPMESLRRIIADEAAAGANRESMWENSLRKDGVIETNIDAPAMSDEARESFLIDVEDSLTGADGSNRPLMLLPGQSWKDAQWSPKEMEWLSARKLSRLEVAASFHLPGSLLLANEQGREPDEHTLRYFYQFTLPPRLSRVEREIEAQLLPEFTPSAAVRRKQYIEFNLDAKLRGSFEEQARIMATTAGGPIVTVNEARARLNLPPIEGGDLIFVPLNSVRAGGPQGAPQSPIETPAVGLEPTGTTPGDGVSQGASAEGSYVMGKGSNIEDLLKASDARMKDAGDREAHAQFLRDARVKFEVRWTTMIMRYFDRQSPFAERGLKRERWDRELADDMFGVALQEVEFVGEDAAERINGFWDTEVTADYIRVSCKNEAKQINSYIEQTLEDDKDPYTEAFARAIGTRQTTFWMSWAVMEAAKQNGALVDDREEG